MEGVSGRPPVLHRVRLIRRDATGPHTVQLVFSRPEGFQFTPGQSLRLIHAGVQRDYSIASGPADPFLSILARVVPGGALTPVLASARPGDAFSFEGPRGFFAFQPSTRPAVFVATGTGAAPFLSMARSGVAGFTLLHGVRESADLLYPEELRRAAAAFVPCISRGPAGDCFAGRVTEFARQLAAPGPYDFYLCGRAEMIGEMSLLIDERFPGSRVYTEIFF